MDKQFSKWPILHVYNCTINHLLCFLKDGVHQEREEAEPVHTEVELKLMFSQDQKYVTMKRTSELNVSHFSSSLHIPPSLPTKGFQSTSLLSQKEENRILNL